MKNVLVMMRIRRRGEGEQLCLGPGGRRKQGGDKFEGGNKLLYQRTLFYIIFSFTTRRILVIVSWKI